MKIESGIFAKRDPESEAVSIGRAREDIAAGRFIEHAKVAAWLKTWGTPDQRPIPPEWLE